MSVSNKNDKLVRTLSLCFDLPLHFNQIARWRGAFIEMAGRLDDRFHNHQDGAANFHYRYPIIQYRVWKGQAAIFAVNEGVSAVQKVLAVSSWNINWNGAQRPLLIKDLHMDDHYLKTLSSFRRYQLYKYLALNQENYKRWQRAADVGARIQLLERLLRNHLLSCLWGLGWESKEEISVKIQEIRRSQMTSFKGIKQLTFDLAYDANILLPPQIALGKAVSRGFGWQTSINSKV